MLSYEEFRTLYNTLSHMGALHFARQLGVSFSTALKWVIAINKEI